MFGGTELSAIGISLSLYFSVIMTDWWCNKIFCLLEVDQLYDNVSGTFSGSSQPESQTYVSLTIDVISPKMRCVSCVFQLFLLFMFLVFRIMTLWTLMVNFGGHFRWTSFEHVFIDVGFFKYLVSRPWNIIRQWFLLLEILHKRFVLRYVCCTLVFQFWVTSLRGRCLLLSLTCWRF